MPVEGIVVTDALDMAGVTGGLGAGETAVRSLEAGSDVLLMPADPDAAIRAVVAAVRKKRLSEKRIEERIVPGNARAAPSACRRPDVVRIGGG